MADPDKRTIAPEAYRLPFPFLDACRTRIVPKTSRIVPAAEKRWAAPASDAVIARHASGSLPPSRSARASICSLDTGTHPLRRGPGARGVTGWQPLRSSGARTGATCRFGLPGNRRWRSPRTSQQRPAGVARVVGRLPGRWDARGQQRPRAMPQRRPADGVTSHGRPPVGRWNGAAGSPVAEPDDWPA